MVRFKSWLQGLRARFLGPTHRQRVQKLIAGISGLEIKPEEYVRLAPLPGVYGPFKLFGNSHPLITYDVFDKALMEFVHMEVRLHLPARVEIKAWTQDLGVIEYKPIYLRPFTELSHHLYRYFPFPMPENQGTIHAG